MPLPLAAIGGIVSGLGAVGKLFSGASQTKKGKKMLAGLKDPGYQIPAEYQANLAQAEQLARQGIPAEQYNLATTNIQRGTQAGLRQLGRMSNPFAGIAGLARSQSDSLAQLDASNAAARRQNILGAMGARRELAGQKLAQQQYAQQRYFDQVNQANALMGAGRQNVAGALSSIGNIGLGLIGAGGSNPKVPSSTPLSPAAMSIISNYSQPALKNLGSPSYFDMANMGNPNTMNLGSLNKPGRFSGFGFSK